MVDKALYKKVTIVGVGMMGGSFGMALKKAGLAEEVMGWGRSESKLKRAQTQGAVDSWSLERDSALSGSELLVFATPGGVTASLSQEWMAGAPPGCLITDLCSVKGDLPSALTSLTGPSRYYVSSHPMCGSEKSGVEGARSDLFRGRLCFLTPVAKTKKRSLREIQSLWQALKMMVVSLSPSRHDQIVAAVSHLPHLLAAALVNQLGDQKLLEFTGPGLADSTRIAASDPLLWLEIIRQNRKNILRQLDLLTASLTGLKKMVEEDRTSRLRAWLQKARLRRRKLSSSQSN